MRVNLNYKSDTCLHAIEAAGLIVLVTRECPKARGDKMLSIIRRDCAVCKDYIQRGDSK